MKQGTANNTKGAQKQEPNSQGINPHYAADIGLQHVYVRSEPMYEGRGIEAPVAGTTTHHCGSQGKH